MDALARAVDQCHGWKYAAADELTVKIEHLKTSFMWGTLPFPNARLNAAWKGVPNTTMDALPLATKAESIFLQAPPPTPMGHRFDTDDVILYDSDSSLHGNHNQGRPTVKDLESPPPSAMKLRTFEGYSASGRDSSSGCSHSDSDRLSDPRVEKGVEDSNRAIANGSPSPSDIDSVSSSNSRSLPTPSDFRTMVNQWLLVYHSRGTDSFFQSLIVFATMSVASAPLSARIARAVIRNVTKTSARGGRDLQNTIRFSALEAFKKHWESDHVDATSTATNGGFPSTPYGVNIASFIGGLFDVKISEARDIWTCLSLLLQGEKSVDRLCAMHALLAQANDKLCKRRNLPALTLFKEDIMARNEKSEEFLWAPTARSKIILSDILSTIGRWSISQADKREQVGTSSGNRTMPKGTVGPRFLLYDSKLRL